MKSLTGLFVCMLITAVRLHGQTYVMPAEDRMHEGTWLQWPHQYEYGISYRNSLDATWVAMTAALVPGEKVHIIAYNAGEQSRITTLLNNASVNMANVDFQLFQTNDVWVRDNGPIYVRDSNSGLHIEDWGFNGWGGKYNYTKCDAIPAEIAGATGIPFIDLNTTMIVEGGAYLVDGRGVLMACRSSILSQSPANTVRNPGMTQAQAEAIFSANLGISKFIWLDGLAGGDITDMHIDGFVQLANDSTIVTMDSTDLGYWGIPAADINTLYNASDVNNVPYHFVHLPLTQNNVFNTSGDDLGYKGSYCNYYIANTVVLVPNYNDPNDAIANNMIQALYPARTVMGIDVRNLYENGGMVHCVTQQQPALLSTRVKTNRGTVGAVPSIRCYPNPANDQVTFSIEQTEPLIQLHIQVYSTTGILVNTVHIYNNINTYKLNVFALPEGIYFARVRIDEASPVTLRFEVMR